MPSAHAAPCVYVHLSPVSRVNVYMPILVLALWLYTSFHMTCQCPFCFSLSFSRTQRAGITHTATQLHGTVIYGWCTPGWDRLGRFSLQPRPQPSPVGSLRPTQPGRVTKPTQGHPGSPWGAPQVECWPLRREPQPPAQHGSCAAERCRSRARPGQRLPPCMHSVGTSRHLLVTSPKRARAI